MRKLTHDQAAAMGRATSVSKLRSSWENGKLGGRPRRVVKLADGTELRVRKEGPLYAVTHGRQDTPDRFQYLYLRDTAKQAAALMLSAAAELARAARASGEACPPPARPDRAKPGTAD